MMPPLLWFLVFTSIQSLSWSSNPVKQILSDIGSIPLPSHCVENIENAEKSSRNGVPKPLMAVAVCFHRAADEPRALYLYGLVREQNPNYSYALVNIGLISLKNGDAQNAIALFQQYLNEAGGIYGDQVPSDPIFITEGTPCRKESVNRRDCVAALNNLGSAYLSLSDSRASLPYLRRAIEIGDDDMLHDVYSNFGGHLANIGDIEGAADLFVKSFWSSYKQGHLNPASLVRRALLIPAVILKWDESKNIRNMFEAQIKDIILLGKYGGTAISADTSDLFRTSSGVSRYEDIKNLPQLGGTLTDWTSGIQTPHFYFHYYGYHDRPIQELVAQMYGILCPSSLYQVSEHLENRYMYSSLSGSMNNGAPMVPMYTGRFLSTTVNEQIYRKLKIGFVSSHFGGDEPHGLLLMDVIRRLPKKYFNVVAVMIGVKEPTQDFIDAISGNYFQVGYNDALARRILMKEELDCLVFAEMQNEAVIHFLGYQRFAPVQVLVMGSPVTSGNPSVDYFISGDRLEYPFRTHLSGDRKDEEPYSEQVVLLDGQSISFPYKHDYPRQDASKAAGDAHFHDAYDRGLVDEFGIPHSIQNNSSHIYMCFQSLHKIQPVFDDALAKILHADHDSIIILQAARTSQRTEAFSNRLMDAMISNFCSDFDSLVPCPSARKAYSRILFVPRTTSYKLKDVLKHSSVILHPWPFGGSKTAADALHAGIPLVTYPQPYLRGRLAASFYVTMELHTADEDISASSCCVAHSVEDYVSKALRLGLDKEYNRKVASAISRRSHRIWDDKQTSFEWARFLTRALGVSVSKEELMFDLDYTPEIWQEDDVIASKMEHIQKQWKRFRNPRVSKNFIEPL